ncbi:hypothetical protein FBUS_02906 [Fasciolopsis buskii]|uniref:Uncharacterized protein n=1 Tax=Fasciolopsis buskii TaxID=27845 RepID=A0A8E0RJI1_9TREM|nr:hypothetical protein FBUS_02906 [Fasciolopsis buski]
MRSDSTRSSSGFDLIRERFADYLPQLIPHPPPVIRGYGDLPFFHPCRLSKKDTTQRNAGFESNQNSLPNAVRLSIPRDSIGARSQDIPISNFQWLLNKKFTCVFMWFGVICLIVGVIALQIASFFRHKRSDILSTGVGCLSASLCLLTVSMFSFLHAHLIVYDWEPDSSGADRPIVTFGMEDRGV